MIRYIETLRPHILIRNEENLGVARAWNQGISLANTDKYLILNSDVVVAKGWFEYLIAALDREDILCIQPEFETGKDIEGFNKRAEDYLERSRDPIHTSGFIGFCFGIKKETIEKIGYFDEAFKVWVDKDYYHRIRQVAPEPPPDTRYQVWSLPNVLIHHFESKTLRSMEDSGFSYRDEDEAAWNAKWE